MHTLAGSAVGTADGRAELAYWRRRHPAAFGVGEGGDEGGGGGGGGGRGGGGGVAEKEEVDPWRLHHPDLYVDEANDHDSSSDGVDLDASIDSVDAALDAARELRHRLDAAILAEERAQEADASYLDVWL